MICDVTIFVWLFAIIGWEYCVEATLASWGAVEKTYHLCRRRRWVRPRSLVADPKQLEVIRTFDVS